MSGQTALILGATGATGKCLLRELLSSSNFTKVGEFGRRVTPLDGLPNNAKLTQKTVDFERIQEAGLKDEKWDVVFITMGTTRAQAGSMENFRKIDQEFVVNAAKAARSTEYKQRLVYLSVAGANVSSMIPYFKYSLHAHLKKLTKYLRRSKAETETLLASLGYDDNIMCRASTILDVDREQPRLLESLWMPIARATSHFSQNAAIGVTSLAKSMRVAGELGSSGLHQKAAEATQEAKGDAKFTVVPNSGLLALSKV